MGIAVRQLSTITLQDGTVVVMIYMKGTWSLPTLTRRKAADLHHDQYIATVNCMKEQVSDSDSNPYKALLDLVAEAEQQCESTVPADMSKVEEVDTHIMQLIHNSWGHPSNSKMEQIVRFYKRKGFLPGFLKTLKHFQCKVCAVAKAGRVYKHTKHMKEKMANNKRLKSQPAAKGTPKQELVKVLLEHEVQDIADEDDLENVFDQEELHMDFAHFILLGYGKELYYLLFVVGCCNFMWATLTTTHMEPEGLLRDFLSVLNLQIGKIRTDNEFTASTKFKAFCQKRAMCPSAAYMHTMQARAEGADSI
eukprot:2354896-Rhodomonas_salina.1